MRNLLMKYFWWFDSYLRKYGGPNVKVHQTREIGDYNSDDVRNLPAKRYFFEETPHLWGGKRVLDIGCGNSRTLETLAQVYPNIDYVGLDIKEGEGVDIVADANRRLPFDANEFDTICAFGFLPENIKHFRRSLKPDGHLVASCNQNFFNQKPEWYAAIRRAFRIEEERSYAYTFQPRDSEFKMPIEATFLIARQK